MISYLVFAFFVPLAANRKCQPEKSINVLECQRYGISGVPDLPPVVANQIHKMNLTSNSIQILHEDTFKYFTNLVELIVDDNRLQTITENALNGLVNLKILSLRNNILVIQPECLSQKAFKNLEKLIRLDISENPLGVIKENFFKPLHNLQELYIEKAVKGLLIEKGAFRGLTALTFISLANNEFESFPEYLMEDFKKMSLTQILLHGNKWNCDCNLRWLKIVIDIINKRNSNNEYTKYPKPICEQPFPFKMMELQMIGEENYQCKPKMYSKGYTIKANQNSNISLICKIYANPVLKISWFKDGTLVQSPHDGMKIWSTDSYINNATLFIENAEHGFDDGQYRCEAGNRLGKVTANFTVQIVPNFISKKVQIHHILILIGIGASVLIVLIGIIGVIMYIFLGKKNHCIENNGNNNRYRNRTPKTITVDNSEALENFHFLDNVQDNNINNSHSMPDVNTLLAPTILSSDETKNIQFLNQLLTNYVPQCPIHISTETGSENINNVCPLHGTTPILSKQCLLNCSPLIICTSSLNKPQSPSASHYSNCEILNSTNDLRNSLLGNVEAFYSLERHMNIPKSNNYSETFKNQSMTSSFTSKSN